MKKALSLLTLSLIFSCAKPEKTPKVVPPTTCDTGGIVGTFYQKRHEGAVIPHNRLTEVLLKEVGTDSFSMNFPSHPTDSTMPKYYSPAMPCRILEFTNSHISMDGYVVYAYMIGDTLVDSFVLNGTWTASLFFTANKY